MEQIAQVVLDQARSWLDRVNTYAIQIQAGIAQNQHLKAIQLAREVLKQLGVPLPDQPTQVEVSQALQQTQELLEGRAIASLLELPEMTAPEPKAAMVIISCITSAAYQVDPHLLPLLIFAQSNLSLQYGNAPESTYGYVMYGMLLAVKQGNIAAGYRFGQLGINTMAMLAGVPEPKSLTWKTATRNCYPRFCNRLLHRFQPPKPSSP